MYTPALDARLGRIPQVAALGSPGSTDRPPGRGVIRQDDAGGSIGRADGDLLAAAQREYSVIVLCAPDFAFVQDGTRRDDAFREQQHLWYKAQLAERAVPYVTVRGSLDDRTRSLRQLLGA